MSVGYNPRIVTDGIIMIFDVGNIKSYPRSGTTWTDMSLNRQVGTLVNSPAYDANNQGSFTFVRASNNYITIPHNAVGQTASNMTINIMAYKDSWASVTERILSKSQGGAYAVLNDSSLGLSTGFYIGGNYRYSRVPFASITPGWQYITITCDGRYVKTFLNGAIANTYDFGSQNTITFSSAQLVVGAETAGAGSIDHSTPKFTGKISHISMYSRILTDSEILQNYNALKGRYV